MLSIALAFGLLWPIPETVVFLPREVRTALVVMGLVVLTGAFWEQTFVQQRISAARTAVILTARPVFATLSGTG